MKATAILALSVLSASLALAVQAAGNAPVRPGDLDTRVLRAAPGQALTLPSKASPSAVVGKS